MRKALPPVFGVTAIVLLAGCATGPATSTVETQTVTVSAAPAPVPASAPATAAPVMTTTVVVAPQAPVAEQVEGADGEMPGPCTDVDPMCSALISSVT